MEFQDFDMAENLMEGISAMNYKVPTPIQQQVIPLVLQGKDVIGCAQTGTGKTAAFLLPVISKLSQKDSGDKIRALVVVPTRELAMQISQQAEGFSYFCGVSNLAVYGGGDGISYSNEARALKNGADIVICTPGRMISHLNMGYVDLEDLEFVILDEADRMLDMGFYDDIMKILSFISKKPQSLLFSATMPPKIRSLARKILNKPEEINISLAKPPEKIKQTAFIINEDAKNDFVKEVVSKKELNSVVVFCDTKSKVKKLTRELIALKLQAEEIHSDLEQGQREEVMNRFKNRQVRILVATDIISRGIDVDNIELVINYDVPHDAEDYVHRVGRTARAEAMGEAYTLVGCREQRKFAAVEKLLGIEVPKGELPGVCGKSPEYNPSGFSSSARKKGRFQGKKNKHHPSGRRKSHPPKKE